MPIFGLRPPNVNQLKAQGDVKGLINALGYARDAVIRRDAAHAACGIVDTRLIEPLLLALKDEDREVRSFAVEALGYFKNAEQVIDPLAATLKNNVHEVREKAAKALGEIGNERAIAPLIAAFDDSEAEVRQASADALGRFGAAAVEPLLIALKESRWNVRQGAAIALGKVGNVCAVDPLVAALLDENWSVREASAVSLDRLGWRPDSDEESAAYWIAKRNLYQCLQFGVSAVKPLLAVLKDESREVRKQVAAALGMLQDARAVEPLIFVLNDQNRILDAEGLACANAAISLGQIGDPRAVSPLLAALTDNRVRVRQGARQALDKIFEVQPVELLLAALNDGDKRVQCGAAQMLGKVIETRSVEPLIAALVSGEKDLQIAAAISLGQIQDARAVEPLIVALQSGEKDLQIAAAISLGQIQDARAVEPLIVALQSGEKDLQVAAAGSLGQIKDARAVDPMITALWDGEGEGSWSYQNAIENSLAEIGQPAVSSLIASLKDRNWKVQASAARILGKIKDTRAVDPLIDLLRGDDKYLKAIAAEALGELEDVRAGEPLIAVFWEDQFRTPVNDLEIGRDLHTIAADALKKLGPAAMIPLMMALFNSDESGQTAVTRDLVELGIISDGILVNPRIAVVNALVRCGPPVVAHLVVMLEDDHHSTETEGFVAQVIQEIGKPAVEPLKLLFQRSSRSRRPIIHMLRLVGDMPAILKDIEAADVLIAALYSSEYPESLEAAYLLDALGWQPANDDAGKRYTKIKEKSYDWEAANRIHKLNQRYGKG